MKAPQKNLFFGYSSVDRRVGQTRLKDLDLIKQDILNHFHTRRGERVMMPDFGSIIWDMLFEPLTDANRSLIEEDVRFIVEYDPRVELQSFNVVDIESGLRIDVGLLYRPYDLVDQMRMDFDRTS